MAPMSWRSLSVPPIWVLALGGAITIAIVAQSAFLTWIPVLLAACVLVTFVVQIALQSKDGLVDRMIASIGGSLVILAVATVALAVAYPTAWPWAAVG